MTDRQRKVETFSAGCPVCNAAVERITDLACPSCDVTVLDMTSTDVSQRAETLGIKSIPAVVIDGKLADCCSNRSFDEDVLRAAGLGQTIG